jgi:hypothetical protein
MSSSGRVVGQNYAVRMEQSRVSGEDTQVAGRVGTFPNGNLN